MKKYIDIWAPRWHDKVVLVAMYKVKPKNETTFIRLTDSGREYTGRYKVNTGDVLASPVDSNGAIRCYAVPLDKLERV